ncbi:hypothetical protein L7D48_01115 [Streptomyces sp. S1A]|uniref:hypothetical protein n=1 Tax=Streptomyces sp. ICN903 TaxID=2964654 RepID=UPI001EDBBFF4|nr:hypothetical protein [Streptomyces sp. ICN903]MCG3039184.1 hypothetical protein [Streptomyces sp. ICN903]
MTAQLPCPPLFDGHTAGAYTLPDELTKLRDTYTAVQAQPYPEPPENPWEVIQRVAVETVDAVHHGKPLPDPAQIEAARAAERVHQDVLDMLQQCLDIAARRVSSALHTMAEDIITEHLRPAHDQTVEAFRDALAVLRAHGEIRPRHLLTAPPKVRKAAEQLDVLAERYDRIHAARSALWSKGVRCTEDPQNKYGAVRNYHALHPVRLAMARAPWHGLSTRDFLIWMHDHGGQLWLPTPDEQAQAVADETHIGQSFPRRITA